MSKELDLIKQSIANRQQELNIAEKNKRLEEERKRIEEEQHQTQKTRESELRSKENKMIFESAGIVRLFEEIRNSGIVKAKSEPQYKYVPRYREKLFGDRVKVGNDKVKISDYEPARINWGHENQDVTLAFDIREDSGDRYSAGYYYDNHITFVMLNNKKIGIKELDLNHKPNIKEIEDHKDIPKLIAEQISKTINKPSI